MLTNQRIIEIALRQSAWDLCCAPEDFLRDDNVVVPYRLTEKAKRYYQEPTSAHLVTYGHNVVASVAPGFEDEVNAYLQKYTFYHCFETPNLHVLDDALRRKGQRVCFMAEYFLPRIEKLTSLPCPYPTRLLTPMDFAPLYRSEWSNALCEKRKNLDVLGVGAYDGETLVGLAACSMDADDMWQIGVDVLPDYRHRGIAKALTSALAREILERDKVPFYCCAWSNIASAKNAVASGFVPAWAELSVKPIDYVDKMNQD